MKENENIVDIKNLNLKEYEEICDSCNGEGSFFSKVLCGTLICRNCMGRGKITWIDKIKNGKKLLQK